VTNKNSPNFRMGMRSISSFHDVMSRGMPQPFRVNMTRRSIFDS